MAGGGGPGSAASSGGPLPDGRQSVWSDQEQAHLLRLPRAALNPRRARNVALDSSSHCSGHVHGSCMLVGALARAAGSCSCDRLGRATAGWQQTRPVTHGAGSAGDREAGRPGEPACRRCCRHRPSAGSMTVAPRQQGAVLLLFAQPPLLQAMAKLYSVMPVLTSCKHACLVRGCSTVAVSAFFGVNSSPVLQIAILYFMVCSRVGIVPETCHCR